MAYELKINFSSNDLNQIYAANQSVVLVKNVSSTFPNTQTAWIVFRPMMSNQVMWESLYQAYTCRGQIMNGAMISPALQANVGFGQAIPYNNQGFGQPETGAAPLTSMSIINLSSNPTTMGLSLSGNVNGSQQTAPICALSVMLDTSVTLTPGESLSVFMSSYMNAGTVICNLPSNTYSFSYDSGSTSYTLQYSGSTGTFIKVG